MCNLCVSITITVQSNLISIMVFLIYFYCNKVLYYISLDGFCYCVMNNGKIFYKICQNNIKKIQILIYNQSEEEYFFRTKLILFSYGFRLNSKMPKIFVLYFLFSVKIEKFLHVYCVMLASRFFVCLFLPVFLLCFILRSCKKTKNIETYYECLIILETF